MSVNGPRAPSATRWAGAQGPNRDRRDRVGLYQIAIRRNRAPGVEESDDEGVERAIGAHPISSASRVSYSHQAESEVGRTCPFSN